MAPVTRQSLLGDSTMSSRIPVSPRRSQPRRKTLTSQPKQQDGSLEMLQSKQANGHAQTNEDAMDVDEDEISAANLAHPLREIAERVGREVELFAEKMDTLKPAFDASRSDKRERAGLLVKEYRTIAEETVSRLTKEHGDEQQRSFRRRWQGRRAYLADEEEEENLSKSYKDPRVKTVLADLEDWQSELQTWQLLDGLLDCRYPHDASIPADQHAQELTTSQDRFEADGDTWTEFLATSDSARDKLTILKWLESTANTDSAFGGDLEMIEEELEEATIKKKGLFTSGWSDTKSCIKAEKVLRLWEGPVDSASMTAEIRTRDGTGTVVTQLDFDAVSRQGRHIEIADREFESCFWNICWVMFRRGMPMNKVREWCIERNEFARALVVGAVVVRSAGEDNDAGIHARLRWRKMCRTLAKEGGGYTSAERAVFALLGGDRGMAEKMSRSWNDYLFASVNSLLLGQYEMYVLQHHAAGIPQAMQQVIRNALNTSVPEDAIQGMRTVLAALNKMEHSQPDARFESIQATIIADNVKQMLFHQGVSLARQAKESTAEFNELIERDVASLMSDDQFIEPISDEPNILRILAHLYLIFLDLGVDFGSKQELEAIENVLSAYIAFLRFSGKMMPIPAYASRLSPNRCNTVMAKIVSDIQDPQQRATMMEMMEIAGIDVVEVVEKYYDAAIEHTHIGAETDEKFVLQLCTATNESMWPGRRVCEPEDLSLTADEKLLIHSLEWFLLLDRQWAMTFAALTDVAIKLLITGRVTAALRLFAEIPYRETSMRLTSAMFGKSGAMDVMEEDGDAVITELTGGHSLRTSRHRKSSRMHRQSLPISGDEVRIHRELLKRQSRAYYKLGQLVEVVRLMWDWAEAEDDFVSVGDARGEMAKTKKQLEEILAELTDAMEPILHGELADGITVELTHKQLQQLQQTYVPELVISYVSILHSAGHLLSRENLLKCMDVATEIAQNDKLVKCITEAGRTKDLVDSFALTSKAMLVLNQSGASKRRKGKGGRSLGLWEIQP